MTFKLIIKNLFLFFSNIQCEKLIRLNVPSDFIRLAYDDTISSIPRLIESSKLSIILATLIRCFDVSMLGKTKQVRKIHIC